MENQTQPIPATLPPVTPKKSSTILIILLFILFLAATLASAYLYFQNQTLKTQLATLQSQPTPTPTPADPTADWKKYSNSAFNFSLKVPQNLTIGENGMSTGNLAVAPNVVIYESTKTSEAPRFAVSIKSSSNTLEQLARNHYQKLTANNLTDQQKQVASQNLGYPVGDNKIVQTFSPANFFNLPSFQYLIKGNTVDDGAVEYGTPEEEHRYIWVEKDKTIFLISYTNNDLMTQILSTFKFNDVTSNTYTCPATGWVDCMPILDEAGQKRCSFEAMSWYKENCPDFQGGAL